VFHGIYYPPLLRSATVKKFMVGYVNLLLTNSMVPQPEGSSPYSQEPATGPYPGPTESIRHPPANLPKILQFEKQISST
jgi:hypothetical protein